MGEISTFKTKVLIGNYLKAAPFCTVSKIMALCGYDILFLMIVTVWREIFEGENFRGSVGREHFAEKIFIEC